MAPAPTADDLAFVHAVTRRILGSDDRAADAAQNALLSAHDRRAQFAGRSAYRTWLYRIAVYAALTELRRQRGRRHEQPVALELVDPAPSPETTAGYREQLDQIGLAVAALDAPQRAAFAMRVAGCSDAEIAASLNISVANVKVRAHRARVKLRHLLATPEPAYDPI
jgi:RNA polymerase sigma-70 factor (ECF subfamily)